LFKQLKHLGKCRPITFHNHIVLTRSHPPLCLRRHEGPDRFDLQEARRKRRRRAGKPLVLQEASS
jgi:hypothetical protein